MRAGLSLLSTSVLASFRVAESQGLNTSRAEHDARPGRQGDPGKGGNRVHVQTKVFSALQAASCVKSDGWQTTDVRRPGLAER